MSSPVGSAHNRASSERRRCADGRHPDRRRVRGRRHRRPGAVATSASATGASSRSTSSARTLASIDATGLVVAPASSTSTPTTTPSCSGTRRPARRRCTASPPCIGGNCGFTLAPAGRRARRLPHADDGAGRGHAARGARGRRAVGLADVRRVPRPPRRHASASTPGSSSATPPSARVVMGDELPASRRPPSRSTAMAQLRRTRRSRPARSASRRRPRRPTTTATASPVPSRGATPDELRRAGRRGARRTRARRSSSSSPGASTGSPTTRSTCMAAHVARGQPAAQLERAQRVDGCNPDGHRAAARRVRLRRRARRAGSSRSRCPTLMRVRLVVPLRVRPRRPPRLAHDDGAAASPRGCARWPTPTSAAASTRAPAPPRPGSAAGHGRLGARSQIVETFAPENDAPSKGGPSATSRPSAASDPFDALLDIVVADELRTGLSSRRHGRDDDDDWKLRAEVWRDPRTVIGGVRRRRPPRHDVRRHLLDGTAQRGCPRAA